VKLLARSAGSPRLRLPYIRNLPTDPIRWFWQK